LGMPMAGCDGFHRRNRSDAAIPEWDHYPGTQSGGELTAATESLRGVQGPAFLQDQRENLVLEGISPTSRNALKWIV